MITCHIPGRLRIRTPDLTVSDTARTVEQKLRDMPGVTGTTINLRTGSLLVLYDTAEVNPANVPALLENIALRLSGKASRSSPSKRAGTVREKKILLGLLPLMIVLGFADLKRAHIYAGTAFAIFTGHHIYDRRSRLFK